MMLDPKALGPFYPAQIATGETFVVNGSTGKVVETIDGSFDTVERWTLAKKRANKLNAELWNRRRVTKNRLVVAFLVGLMVACIWALFALN